MGAVDFGSISPNNDLMVTCELWGCSRESWLCVTRLIHGMTMACLAGAAHFKNQSDVSTSLELQR